MKKKQRRSCAEGTNLNYLSPLTHLNDTKGFAGKAVFSAAIQQRKVKMMMLKVVARTVGLHHLILSNFYRHLQNYVQPHQRDVKNLLASVVQACHEAVPPDAVDPLFQQIVNEFVHDRSHKDSDDSGKDVPTTPQPQVVLNKEAVYKIERLASKLC